MPQLDFATYPSQFLWLLIIFFLQYIIVAKVIVPGFQKIYKARQKYINNEITSAEALIKKAEALRKNYESKLLKARENNAKITNETVAEIQKSVDQKIYEVEEKLAVALKKQEEELQDLANAAKKELEIIAVQSASLLLSKATKHDVTYKDLNKYIN